MTVKELDFSDNPATKKSEKPVLTFDTEDDSNGNVAIINFYDGEKHYTFTGHDLRLEAWSFIKEQGPAYYWAVNLEYDLINVFGDWLGKMVTLQYTKGGLIRGSYRDRKNITFFDTLRHWPISVKGMGLIIGKEKLEVNGEFINIEYCRRDTEIVWDFVTLMLKRYKNEELKIKATLPAMTLQLMEKFFSIPKGVIPFDVQEFFRQGYYGGRVEIFNLNEIQGKINYYDFNSLYPSVMAESVFPDLESWYKPDRVDFSLEGMAEIEIEYPEQKICALPYRAESEIIYPYGKMTGVWCYPEIRQAMRDGAKILHIKSAIEFDKTCRPFQGYVNYCYNNRLEAKKHDNKLDDIFWKLAMNSLYGKFAQGSDLFMIYDDKEIEMEGRAAHVNVIWSAYVTAYGRLKLLNAMRSVSEVYYCDTDSIFTPDEMDNGKELGQLKLEGSFSRVLFKGNKIYTLTPESKLIGPIKDIEKAKGVNKEVAGDFIRTGRAVYKKPMRFRESRKSIAGIANKWYEITKELKKVYIKRKVQKNGQTSAWDIREFLGQEFIKNNF